uniref:Uncharacterized protein n=1 Tax=Bos taurus TaxID=9913 RepID=A0ABI0P1G7_BOVIN
MKISHQLRSKGCVKVTKSWHLLVTRTDLQSSERVGSTRHEQLYDMRLRSAFSHHLGQLQSTSHIGLIHVGTENKDLWAQLYVSTCLHVSPSAISM